MYIFSDLLFFFFNLLIGFIKIEKKSFENSMYLIKQFILNDAVKLNYEYFFRKAEVFLKQIESMINWTKNL